MDAVAGSCCRVLTPCFTLLDHQQLCCSRLTDGYACSANLAIGDKSQVRTKCDRNELLVSTSITLLKLERAAALGGAALRSVDDGHDWRKGERPQEQQEADHCSGTHEHPRSALLSAVNADTLPPPYATDRHTVPGSFAGVDCLNEVTR